MNYLHNQVQLTGRVAADPEIYFTSDGTPKTRLALLQDARRGDGQQPPARFTLIGWEGLARQLHEVVRANDRLFVQGKRPPDPVAACALPATGPPGRSENH